MLALHRNTSTLLTSHMVTRVVCVHASPCPLDRILPTTSAIREATASSAMDGLVVMSHN